jgi:hypothetical protein
MMEQDFRQAVRSALTPAWIKELDPAIGRMDATQMARMFGVCLALLDHARHHLPSTEWNYIHDQLVRKITEQEAK